MFATIRAKEIAKTVSSFYMDDKLNSTYSELVNAAHTAMSSYKVSDEEIHNLQEATQLQSKCRLWSTHRAGRITASNKF